MILYPQVYNKRCIFLLHCVEYILYFVTFWDISVKPHCKNLSQTIWKSSIEITQERAHTIQKKLLE